MITETVVVQFGCDRPGCRLSAVEEGTREKAWERAHSRGWRMKTLSLGIAAPRFEVLCPTHAGAIEVEA